MAAYSGPFYYFDQAIQTPFSSGVSSTVNSVVFAVQGPITAVVVLWIIVTSILVMRGDVTARIGVSKIVTVSIIVGLVMSSTLYNEYITTFFTVGLPDWIASSVNGVSGTTPSAQEFDTIWMQSLQVFSQINSRFNWYDVIYNIQLGMLQTFVIIPIAVMFLVYEVAKIMIDVMVCVGPFLLVGYMFGATRGIADRFIGKLISLSILVLLVDIVLAIIVSGYVNYIASTLSIVASNTNRALDIAVAEQMVVFFAIGSLIATFLPGLAAYLGGGVSVSPLAMANTAVNVASFGKSVGGMK
jgi:type IV secretion system protein VirB6